MMPDKYKHCDEVIVHINCDCFGLVQVEARLDTVFMVIIAALLLAIFVYAAYIVLSQDSVSAFDWSMFWLSLASLFGLLALSINKSSAIHKIKYKRYRNSKPWYEAVVRASPNDRVDDVVQNVEPHADSSPPPYL
jgi:hypothetical protein